MLFSLLLTFGLLAACGNPDDLDDNLKARLNGGNENSNSNDSIQYPTYEANWVLDRQVIDKTVMRNINNQRLEIANMPNEVLLQNLLTNEQQNLPIEQLECVYYTFVNFGYNAATFYNNKADATSDKRKYLVEINKQTYQVWIDEGQVGGTYNQNTDQWTLEWKIKKVSIYNEWSSLVETKDYTFDPELTLILVSTKRLN
jgi:hypothetical protein